MTVKYKRLLEHGTWIPKRWMTAEDIGLSLLRSEYDPVLLAVGIKAPRLTRKQEIGDRVRASSVCRNKFNISDEAREKRRDRRHFNNTVLGKAVRREVSAILQRYRSMGEYRK